MLPGVLPLLPGTIDPIAGTSARHVRIRAEFREMPGLRLTLWQASRLFNVDPQECERVLGDLVRLGDLWTDGQSYCLPGVGRRFA